MVHYGMAWGKALLPGRKDITEEYQITMDWDWTGLGDYVLCKQAPPEWMDGWGFSRSLTYTCRNERKILEVGGYMRFAVLSYAMISIYSSIYSYIC
jgi:hypothetical protein